MKQLKGDESTSKVYSNSFKEKNELSIFQEKEKILLEVTAGFGIWDFSVGDTCTHIWLRGTLVETIKNYLDRREK